MENIIKTRADTNEMEMKRMIQDPTKLGLCEDKQDGQTFK
jgi:hypothetical protein